MNPYTVFKAASDLGKAIGIAAAQASHSPEAWSLAKAAAAVPGLIVGAGKVALGVGGAILISSFFGW
ncbi:hypothetical protein [Alicyclobacillus macrosporangiidus]|uniref:hypothetical protein n=1 Tax=Alicyclobacillus macrosporangiidus TaxID=392015 RepID=UPI000494DB13|nr:hypothetical protein [Alicyclobacillus macrosporangiidus]